MKPGRQSVILDIITQQEIETQNQLMEALALRGIKSTQATLSRDIKDMRIIKTLGASGKYKYAAPEKNEGEDLGPRLRKIFRESLISCDVAQNIVVIKTLPGLANACCSAMDNMEIDGLVGTLAGDDTGFLAMRDNEYAQHLFREIEMLF